MDTSFSHTQAVVEQEEDPETCHHDKKNELDGDYSLAFETTNETS